MMKEQMNQEKKRFHVNVFIRDVSGERLWEINRPIPPVKIATNLNLISVQKPEGNVIEVPFVFAISYNPPVAQISFKGRARITGDKDELNKIHALYVEKKAPPPTVVQAISNIVFLESVLISRTLNIPPPIPLPKVPIALSGKKRREPTYRA
jgi:hypothetical protein